MGVERELKYSTTEEHVPSHAELAAATRDSGLELGAPTVERYVDVYYDTPAVCAPPERRSGAAIGRAVPTPR